MLRSHLSNGTGWEAPCSEAPTESPQIIRKLQNYGRLEAQGLGAKASLGAWHENTKGTAQLCSFFVNVDERV